MLQRLLNGMSSQRDADKSAKRYRELIRREAKIGGELFGPVQPGGRREFFCLDAHTWVWHEEWTDQHGQHHAITTRYDVRPQGILKAQDGQPYRYISKEEGKRFCAAVRLYHERVHAQLYGNAV